MSRFVQFETEELADLCQKKNAKSTDRATNFGVKLLKSFFQETGREGTVENLSVEDLNDLLVKFYAQHGRGEGIVWV